MLICYKYFDVVSTVAKLDRYRVDALLVSHDKNKNETISSFSFWNDFWKISSCWREMRSGLNSFQFPKSSFSLYAHILKEKKTTWDIVEETPKKNRWPEISSRTTLSLNGRVLAMERFPSLFFPKSNVCVWNCPIFTIDSLACGPFMAIALECNILFYVYLFSFVLSNTGHIYFHNSMCI
jgi:hypothetical protein